MFIGVLHNSIQFGLQVTAPTHVAEPVEDGCEIDGLTFHLNHVGVNA